MYKQKLNLLELKNKEWWILHLPIISFFLISIIYFIVACYKLTYAPIWYDEAVEFYYSLNIFSSYVPGRGIANMYQRIISTFQPPLYNVLMFFWLKINQSEWWFRFAGVLAGYFGCIGTYKTIKKYCNWKWAILSMLAFFSTYHVLYYIQECAEYNLLLAFIPWTIYFFFCILENKSWKNIILFILFSVLSIYSQYGAIFIVIPMLLLVFFNSIISKDWHNLRKIIISYICAFIFTALPLYLFFVKQQIMNQKIQNQSIRIVDDISFFYNMPLMDFIKNMFDCFKWNMIGGKLENNPAIVPILTIFIFSILILSLYLLITSKNRIVNNIICLNTVSIVFFYIAAKTKIYAYPNYAWTNWNSFTNRYSLFFIPLWIISIIYSLYLFIYFLPKSNIKRIIVKVIFILFFSFCILGFFNIISSKNVKYGSNVRKLVDEWFNLKCYDSKTLLSSWNDGVLFSYYLTKNKNYKAEIDNDIFYYNNSILNMKKELEKLFSNNTEQITLVDCYQRFSKNTESTIYSIAKSYNYTIRSIHLGNEKLFIFKRGNND